jgi:hypothetical protein
MILQIMNEKKNNFQFLFQAFWISVAPNRRPGNMFQGRLDHLNSNLADELKTRGMLVDFVHYF